MIERCNNPACISWIFYGGKGISVCERWMDITKFVEDMGLRSAGMSIDRIDVKGNYEPSNCRWATELQQQRNRTNVKCTVELAREIRKNILKGMTQKKLASESGLTQSNISRIIGNKIWKEECKV